MTRITKESLGAAIGDVEVEVGMSNAAIGICEQVIKYLESEPTPSPEEILDFYESIDPSEVMKLRVDLYDPTRVGLYDDFMSYRKQLLEFMRECHTKGMSTYQFNTAFRDWVPVGLHCLDEIDGFYGAVYLDSSMAYTGLTSPSWYANSLRIGVNTLMDIREKGYHEIRL